MIKYCIFDLDGTLLNTLGTIKYYMNKTLTRHGAEPISDEECMCFVGSGARALMQRACHARGIFDALLEEKMLHEYMSAYDEDPYYLTEKYEGVDRLICELKAMGIRLAVLSNKPDLAARAAVGRFFGDTFDLVWGARDNIPLKPSPDGALKMLAELGASPSECAYIGDSDVDVLTGDSMDAALNISVTWGFRSAAELVLAGAKELVSLPTEIKNIIIKEGNSK